MATRAEPRAEARERAIECESIGRAKEIKADVSRAKNLFTGNFYSSHKSFYGE